MELILNKKKQRGIEKNGIMYFYSVPCIVSCERKGWGALSKYGNRSMNYTIANGHRVVKCPLKNDVFL